MNIKQRRLQQLIEDTIKSELQRGNLPTSREFIRRMQEDLHANQLHKPKLKVLPVREGATAYSQDLNKLFDDAAADLTILYQSIVEKYDVSLKNFNKFDVDKSKLDYELNKLENQLKELILLHKESGFLTSVFDVFDDLSKVDTGKTTVEVDIKSHQVTLMQAKNNSQKIFTGDAVTSFNLNEKTRKAAVTKRLNGTPYQALTDAVDQFWSEMVYLNESNGEIGGTFEIMFNRLEVCNNIEMELHAGKEIEVSIEYTANGVTWTPVPSIERETRAEGVVSYQFDLVETAGFRIHMKKKESDHSTHLQTGTKYSVVYGYLLGIRKIGFFQTQFTEYGELHSKALTPDVSDAKAFTINKVSLLTDQSTPNGTNIDYFIALKPKEGELPEWKAISPVNEDAPRHDQVIDFKNISQAPAETFRMDPNIAEGEYKLESLYANGIDFYKLADIENVQIIDGTESLFVGKDSWSVQSYERGWGANYIPSLEDWQSNNPVVKESFLKILPEKNGILLDKALHTKETNYLFTLGVFSRKAEEVVTSAPVSNEPIAIYMNGVKVFEGIPTAGTKVNYVFQSGWNEIKVLVYVAKTIDSPMGASVHIGFNPTAHGAYAYSRMRALEKVSLFDLRYNTKSNDTSKYAIMETNSRYTIVLNKFIPGLEYDFYFDHIDGLAHKEIMLKAVFTLSRSATTLSPKLKSYRLRFS